MRLSDFKDERAIEVVADLIVPISKIAQNKEAMQAKGKGVFEFVSALLKANRKEALEMLAILSDVDPAEYHCTAATVIKDLMTMLSDPDLMALFGVQSTAPASAGSASESTEA